MISAVQLHIKGRVQGVGFRYFAQDTAQELGLAGWVRNAPDGSVDAYAEGSREALEAWMSRLRQGHPRFPRSKRFSLPGKRRKAPPRRSLFAKM